MAPARDLEATIRDHLAQLPAGADVSETIHGSGASRKATHRLTRSPEPVVRRLGYDDLGELGRGGLGVVMEATQQAFDRPVAIKRMLKGDDRLAALHFYAEAVVAAQLQHPNILPIFDLLADAGGRLSLVMKRAFGRTWRTLLRPHGPEEGAVAARFSLDDHLEILLKVCDAVGYAHSRGILHRDLKPDNVMVGDHGEVEVMDWGCAVAFGDAELHPVVPRVEEVDRISGTPTCMAPEMVLLHPNRISERSDVYLLGGLLYDVLTGTRPHRGADMREVLRAAALGEVQPPQERAPARDIPEELATIAMAALAADPDRRTPSVQAFAAELRAYRRHVQAVELANNARRRLEEAGEARLATGVDDCLRRACAAAENAIDLWPDWRSGRAIHADAVLAWARHCLATGGFTQAQALATQAVAAATAADDPPLAAAARGVGDEARRRIALARRHERTVQAMRYGVIVLIGMVAMVAIVAAVVLAGQRRVADEARRTAEEALESLRQEKDQRRADRREAVPAMLAQLRSEVAAGRLEPAEAVAGRILAVEPGQAEAVALHANLLAALGRHAQAAAVAAEWRRLSPDEAIAGELERLCRDAGATDAKVLGVRLADLFLRQRLPNLVAAGQASPAQRLAVYRARLEAAWSGLGAGLVMDPDGSVRFDAGRPSLEGRADCTDITALRGIPFSVLSLAGTKVAEVAPLAGMPLKTLVIDRSPIADLRPLAGTDLAELRSNALPGRTLPDLAGVRVKAIVANGNDRIADLAALRGLPLESFQADAGKVEDLAPLAGLPLRVLAVSGGFRDLAPLRGLPLESLGLAGAFTDLTPLRREGLVELTLRSTALVDAATLPGSIRRLNLDGVDLRNPQQLHRLPLESLRLRYPAGTRPPDPASFDPAHLATLVVDCATPIDLKPFAAAPLTDLTVAAPNQDFTCLARSGLKRVAVGRPVAGSPMWRSLAAFRGLASLESVETPARRIPVATFWPTWSPASTQPVVVIAGELAAVAALRTSPGLTCQRFAGITASVDEIAGRTAAATTVEAAPALAAPPERTGYRFTGYLAVPATAEYQLIVDADDGVQVQLNGQVVIEGDGPRGPERYAATVRLAAGAHPLTLLYFNGGGAGRLSVLIAGPGRPEQAVPPAWWCH